MQERTFEYLLGLAAVTGIIHTIMGPDHYIPFIAMARAGRWSLRKTVLITVAAGLAHVFSSVLLGLIGVAVGLAVVALVVLETARGQIAAWFLLGFGLAYTAWGMHRARLARSHAHLHVHDVRTFQRGPGGHNPRHDRKRSEELASSSMSPWALFTVFLLGPCEPLIPQLMYPAAERSWTSLWAVVTVFGLTTVGTMLAVVIAGYFSLRRMRLPSLERYTHVAAGLALTMCGVAIKLGW